MLVHDIKIPILLQTKHISLACGELQFNGQIIPHSSLHFHSGLTDVRKDYTTFEADALAHLNMQNYISINNFILQMDSIAVTTIS